MTQRQHIIDLARRAGATDEHGGPAQTVFCFTASELQGFAELLVEEMHDFIMEESANDNGIPDLGKVKEHFGVE